MNATHYALCTAYAVTVPVHYSIVAAVERKAGRPTHNLCCHHRSSLGHQIDRVTRTTHDRRRHTHSTLTTLQRHAHHILIPPA